jgi:hypothetical protein
MTAEECKDLIEGLQNATKHRTMHWSEGAGEDQFLGGFAGVGITIERLDDATSGSILVIELRNQVGQLIDDVRSDRVTALRENMEALFGAARRNARGGDLQIEHLLQVLKNM